jgi:hypothetical protein
MPGIHPTLERQLTRHGILDLSAPPTVEQWYRFLERVSQAYADADQQCAALELQLRRADERLQDVHTFCVTVIDQATERVESGAAPDEMLALLATYRANCERANQAILREFSGK